MMIEALPAWQSHYSIATIGNLYVAPSRALRAVGLLLCAINPVNGDPHGARQVYITNVRNQGIARRRRQPRVGLNPVLVANGDHDIMVPSINSFELASRRDLASLRCGTPTVSTMTSAVARSAKSPATMRPGCEYEVASRRSFTCPSMRSRFMPINTISLAAPHIRRA